MQTIDTDRVNEKKWCVLGAGLDQGGESHAVQMGR